MLGHIFKHSFHVRLLHEAELQSDGYDAGILVLMENRDAITAIVDVGHLAVRDLHEDQMPRQYTVAVIEKLEQCGRIVIGAVRELCCSYPQAAARAQLADNEPPARSQARCQPR